MNTVALTASVVSVALGLLAIWLSVTFYRMSNKIAEDTKQAAKGISDSVGRLEGLFDRLYSDTFSMMRDTVSDMRKHIWPESGSTEDSLERIEKTADSKIGDLRDQLGSEISVVMQRIGKTDSRIHGVEERLTQLIDRAIQQTRRVESEAQEEMSMTSVLNAVVDFVRRYGEYPVRRLFLHPSLRRRFPRALLSDALSILLRDGVIEADGDLRSPETVVRFKLPHVPSDQNLPPAG